jgi:protein polybromo-1
MSQHLTLIPREEVLEPKRVMSVFRERVEKHKEEIAELEEREKLVEKEKPVSSQDPYWLHECILQPKNW